MQRAGQPRLGGREDQGAEDRSASSGRKGGSGGGEPIGFELLRFSAIFSIIEHRMDQRRVALRESYGAQDGSAKSDGKGRREAMEKRW